MRSNSLILTAAFICLCVLAIAGCTQTVTPSPSQTPNSTATPAPVQAATQTPVPTASTSDNPRETAAADYHQKLSKAKDDLARLNASYASKEGVLMNQGDFEAYLQVNRNLTIALIDSSNATLAASDVYAEYLDQNSTEYNTVLSDVTTLMANVDVAKTRFNNGVDNYNHWWDKECKEFQHL